MTRSSREEGVNGRKDAVVYVKRSVGNGENVGKVKRVRDMSEERGIVPEENTGIQSEKTMFQEVGEVDAVEVPQGSLKGRCGDFESRDRYDKGGEVSVGAILNPVTSLLSKTLKNPRKNVIANLVRGAISQTDQLRRSPRMEKPVGGGGGGGRLYIVQLYSCTQKNRKM